MQLKSEIWYFGLIAASLCLPGEVALGQKCDIELARSQFSTGQFTSLINNLEFCCIGEKNDDTEACELLAKSYLELGNEEEAEKALKRLYKLNPYYQAKPEKGILL